MHSIELELQTGIVMDGCDCSGEMPGVLTCPKHGRAKERRKVILTITATVPRKISIDGDVRSLTLVDAQRLAAALIKLATET